MGYYSIIPMLIITMGLFYLSSTSLFKFVDAPYTSTHSRIQTLDGLRGFLALAVFFHHGALYHSYQLTHVWTSPPDRLYALLGPLGVSVFFMITGFLFWAQVVAKSGKPDWLRLYIGRVFRIGPIYLVAVTCMIVAVFALTGFHLRVSPVTLLAQVLAWSALGLRISTSLNGFPDPGVLLANVTWSLRYEWFFYISLLLTSLFARRTWSAALFPGLCGVVAIAFCLRADILGHPDGNSAFVALFCVGMLTAVARAMPRVPRLDNPVFSAVAGGLLLLVLCLFRTSYHAVAIAILGVAFFIIASGATLFGLLTSRPARRLGDISFGIYLLQGLWLAAGFGGASVLGAANPTPWLHWTIVGLASFGLVLSALGAHLLVELPGIRLGRALLSRIATVRASAVAPEPPASK